MGNELSSENQQSITRSPKSKHTKSIGTNNLPPLQFHSIHGDNIKLSTDGIYARRTDSFCEGIVFTNRPVRVNERVCIKFIETSSNWGGALRFGFTSYDPIKFKNCMPKYACPDLTNKAGNWIKALCERYSQANTVFSFYVNENGHVHICVNGEDKGVYFHGVNVNNPLWAVLDIYGNTCNVQLIDRRHNIKNKRNCEVENISNQMSTVNIGRANREPLPQIYKNSNFNFMSFHRTRGCNIQLSTDRTVAERSDNHYCQGYVFSQRPLKIGEKLVIQILQTDELYTGSLAFGLTTCNPANLNGYDLPEDPHMLLDRPEYWIVIKDVANDPTAGDELAFKLTEQGQVQLIKNKQQPITLMHVDQSQNFYVFFDLYGSTIKVKVLGTLIEASETPLQSNPNYLNPASNNNQNSNLNSMYTYSQSNSRSNSFLTDPQFFGKSLTSLNKLKTNCNSNGSLITSNECSVCYERPIDCVLYTCGHMCMCYDCAAKQWRVQGGHCPICRAIIRDVIRTYWS